MLELNCTDWGAKSNHDQNKYLIMNDTHELSILTKHYDGKWLNILLNIPSSWVCLTTEGILQNGSIFKSVKHIHKHFDFGVECYYSFYSFRPHPPLSIVSAAT